MKKMILLLIFLFTFSQISFGQTTIWSEDFSSYNDNSGYIGPDKAVTGDYPASVSKWTLDVSNAVLDASTDWFMVNNISGNLFEGRDLDGEVIWTSESIDISLFAEVSISVAVSESGDHESADYVKLYYKIDGSTETFFATNGNNSDDFTLVTAEQTGLNGSTLQIIIKLINNAGEEYLRFDDILVLGTPSGTPVITVSPSSFTALNYINGFGPSDEQIFTISGSNLSSDISITAPTNYEISETSGSGYTSLIALTQSGGSVSETTIYVRLKSGLSIGDFNSKVITASSSGASNSVVTCNGRVAPVLPNLVINEILAEPDGTNGDANGDGISDTGDDEFVEIINNESTTQDFGGYTLSDRIKVRHIFPSPTNVPAGESIVIFGGGTPTNIPGTAQVASTKSLGLNNTGDDIILKSGNDIIDSYTYGSEGDDGQSIGRNPDITGTFVRHLNIVTNSVLFSPGKRNDNGIALPVELTSFTAKATDVGVVLNWATATEINNYGFEIERSWFPKEGTTPVRTDWELIGFVEGSGNSNSPKSYEFIDVNPPSSEIEYRLKQIDTDGKFEYYAETVIIDGTSITDVELDAVPTEFALSQNYPNPFNPSTQISFSLANAGPVNVSIYNVLGQKVTELVNEKMEVGTHNVEFNSKNLASGFYFYRLETPNYTKTMKMLLIK